MVQKSGASLLDWGCHQGAIETFQFPFCPPTLMMRKQYLTHLSVVRLSSLPVSLECFRRSAPNHRPSAPPPNSSWPGTLWAPVHCTHTQTEVEQSSLLMSLNNCMKGASQIKFTLSNTWLAHELRSIGRIHQEFGVSRHELCVCILLLSQTQRRCLQPFVKANNKTKERQSEAESGLPKNLKGPCYAWERREN